MSDDHLARYGLTKEDVQRALAKTSNFAANPDVSTKTPKIWTPPKSSFIKIPSNPNEPTDLVGGELNLYTDLPVSAGTVYELEKEATIESLQGARDGELPDEVIEDFGEAKGILIAFLSLEVHQPWGSREFREELTVVRRLCQLRRFKDENYSSSAFAALEQLARIPDILTAPTALSVFQKALKIEALERCSPPQEERHLQDISSDTFRFLQTMAKAQQASWQPITRNTVRARFIRWTVNLQAWQSDPKCWQQSARDTLADLASRPEYVGFNLDRSPKDETRVLKKLVSYYVDTLKLDLPLS